MPGFASTGFRFDTLSDPVAGRGDVVAVHSLRRGRPLAAPAGAPAAGEASRSPRERVPLLQACVAQLQVDYQRVREQLAVMQSHASRARQLEQGSPYHYGAPNLCVSGAIGSGVGAMISGLYCLMQGAPVWVIGAGGAAAGVTGCAIIGGMRLHARCVRNFHANRGGSVTDRSQLESRADQLMHRILQENRNLAAALRLAQVDAAIDSPALPKELLEIISGYDRPDPSVPASGPRSDPPEPARPA